MDVSFRTPKVLGKRQQPESGKREIPTPAQRYFNALPEKLNFILTSSNNPVFTSQTVNRLSDISLKKYEFTVLSRQNLRRSVILDPSALLKVFFSDENVSLPGIQRLKELIEKVNRYNDNPTDEKLEEMVANHAELRLVLFYFQCIAYQGLNFTSTTLSESGFRWEGAQVQLYQGFQKQAAHHTLLAHINDTCLDVLKEKFCEQFREAVEGIGPIAPELVLLILTFGVDSAIFEHWYQAAVAKKASPEEALQHIFVQWKRGSIIDQESLFYFINNHTLIAPAPVNLLDCVLESELRASAKELLKEVSRSKMHPKEAVKRLSEDIKGTLQHSNELLPKLEKLVTTIGQESTHLANFHHCSYRIFFEAKFETYRKKIEGLESALIELDKLLAYSRLAKRILKISNPSINEKILGQVSQIKKICEDTLADSNKLTSLQIDYGQTDIMIAEIDASIRDRTEIINQLYRRRDSIPTIYWNMLIQKEYEAITEMINQNIFIDDIARANRRKVVEELKKIELDLEIQRKKVDLSSFLLAKNLDALMIDLNVDQFKSNVLLQMSQWIPNQSAGTDRIHPFLFDLPRYPDESYSALQCFLLSRNIKAINRTPH